jgi:cytochrome c biogenesis protein CcdA
MNTDLAVGAGAALWLGVLTSISPCPLATNIAAVSFIGKRVGRIRHVLLSAVLYTAGRMAAYVVLGIVVITGLLSIPDVAIFLQRYMNVILGPVLVLTGLFILEVVRFPFAGRGMFPGMHDRVGSWGFGGAAVLGILFALAFCPVSAALFFGSLIPLSVRYDSRLLLPSLFGVGTGLPVLLFAVLLAFGAHMVGAAFRMLTSFEIWARRATGVVFILVGMYLVLKHIAGVHLPF